MGNVHSLPEIPQRGQDRHSFELSHSLERVASLLESTECWVLRTIHRLEAALLDIDEIGRCLPPGKFKAELDRDRGVLASELKLVKGMMINLWEANPEKPPAFIVQAESHSGASDSPASSPGERQASACD